GLPAGWITDLYEDEHKLWVGTTRGLCEWQDQGSGSVCKTYTSENDLCDYEVSSITKDKDGNLWIGTRCGAKKWARYGFTSYSQDDRTIDPIINSIFENRAGELFVSLNSEKGGRMVSRFDGSNFELLRPNFPPDL